MLRRFSFEKFSYWMPVFLWMGVIFVFSSFEGNVVSRVDLVEFLVKKLIHMIEYGILWMLVFRALRRGKVKVTRAGFVALFITVLYAMTDEFHQSFVMSRHGTVRDVFIDSGGAMLSFWGIKKFLY